MNWFKNLSIGAKLASGFLVVIGCSVALGVYAVTGLGAVESHVDALAKTTLPGITRTSELAGAASQIRRDVLGMFLATSIDERATYRQRIDTEVAALSSQLAAYRATATRPDVQAAIADLDTKWSTYLRVQDALLQIALDPERVTEAAAARKSSRPLFDDVRAAFSRLVAVNANDGLEAADGIYATLAPVGAWTGVARALTLIVGLAVSIGVTRMLTRPMRQLETAARAMARGELGGEVSYQGKDEIGT